VDRTAMSAAKALKAAREAGIKIRLVRDGLVLTAVVPPPAAVLDLLSLNKVAIVTLLRPDGEGWSAGDWRDFYNEQVEVAQRARGLAPRDAEELAFVLCLAEWMARNGCDPIALAFIQQIVSIDPLDLIMGPTRDYEGHPAKSWDSRCESALLGAAEALDALGIRFNPRSPNDFGKIGGA